VPCLLAEQEGKRSGTAPEERGTILEIEKDLGFSIFSDFFSNAADF
jgi:hypothetical protein